MRKIQIVVSGWYGCGNVGDDALLDAIIAGFRRRLGSDTVFHVLAQDPATVRALYPDDPNIIPFAHDTFLRIGGLLRFFLRGQIVGYVRRLRGADLFVLGGGGLIQDANGVRNLLRYMDECLISEWLGTPVIVFGIGVGPLVTRKGKWWSRWIGSQLSVLTTRDRDGAAYLKALGIRKPHLEATADPAILLEPAVVGAPDIESLIGRMGEEHCPVVVCPRPRTSWSQLSDREWQELLGEFADFCEGSRVSLGARILFIPFMKEDATVIDEILSRMRHPEAALSLSAVPRPRDALRLIAHSRYVVGMRLHSLIFAASQAVPMISINYAPKVGSFANEIDPDGMTILERDFRAVHCVDYLKDFQNDYDERRLKLMATVATRKAAAERNFDLAIQLLRD